MVKRKEKGCTKGSRDLGEREFKTGSEKEKKRKKEREGERKKGES